MAICAECTYLKIEDGHSSGKFWCDRKCERHYATDPECYNFCEAGRRESCTINNAIEISKKYTEDTGCYLTTMLCNILKLPDDNLYLNTLRNFRKDILQKGEKYKQLLVEYDIVGPKIASALASDPTRKTIAALYLNNFIIPTIKFIVAEEYDKAVDKYYQMTNNLKNFYSLTNYDVTEEQVLNADIENSGHGIYKQKKITLQ